MKYLLLFLLLLLLPSAAFGWSVISHTCIIQTADDGSDLTTSAIDTTGANLLIIYAAQYTNNTGSVAPTDSRGNTWHGLNDQYDGNSVQAQISYAYDHGGAPLSVGTANTFTLHNDFGLYKAAICAIALSGSFNGDPYDGQQSSATNLVSTIQAGSITPGESNAIVISGVYSTYQDVALSVDGGFTLVDQARLDGSTRWGIGIAYLAEGAATAANPTWTTNTYEGGNISGMASFKPVSGAPALARHRSIIIQ